MIKILVIMGLGLFEFLFLISFFIVVIDNPDVENTGIVVLSGLITLASIILVYGLWN